jgi:DNA-binding response OmpR family regulator
MNVLIADDDGVSRLLLSASLRKRGHDVREAHDGVEALAIWEEERQRLVISDWMMPDLDGLEFCRKIRAESDSELTYVILLTARSGQANYLEAMEAGVDDFLSKPFEKDQLAARLRVAERILDLDENLRTANSDLERRVLERTADLEKALAVKGEFLSRASHELRTPLNHVLGFAQLLEMDRLTHEQKKSVQQIRSSGGHLLQLIDHLLAVPKSQANELSFIDQNEASGEAGNARGKGSLLLQVELSP